MKTPKPQSVLRGTALIFAGRVLNRPLGIIREVLSAALFGTGRSMDSFNLAFTVVTSMRSLFAEQFLAPTVPVYFQRQKESGEKAALLSLSYITTRLNLVALIASIALFIGARPLVGLIAPGFDSSQLDLSATMVRWFAFGGVAIILHRYYSGLFMCFFQYAAVSFTPLLMNVGAIGAMLFFSVKFGVISLAAGYSLGFLAFFFLLALYLPQRGALLKPRWGRGDPGARAYGAMLFPLFLAVSVEQVQLYVDRALASGQPAGALSAQGYALRLIRMSSDFWVGTFGTAIFPVFSSLAASDRKEEFARNFSLALQAVLLFLIFTGAIMISLALPTVQLLLERGAFTFQDSVLTARMLTYYAIAYIAQAIVVVIVQGFYAHGDMKRPMICTITTALIMIMLDFLLIGPLGVTGLAVAMAIGYVFNLIFVYALFLHKIPFGYTLKNLRVVFISLAMAIPLGLALSKSWEMLSARELVNTFTMRLVGLVAFSGIALLLYGAALRLLRIEALEFILDKFKQKWAKSKCTDSENP